MFNKFIKCPHCGTKNIKVAQGYAHAVTYQCNSLKCHKQFTKEFK